MGSLLSSGAELVIASNNAGKVKEIAELLEPYSMSASPASAHNLPEPEETGLTFAANAEIKARSACELTGLPALADDSGLAVEALDGEPGIYSARWAGPEKDFCVAMSKVESELKSKNIAPENWHAAFICDLCLCLPDGTAHHFEGRIDGTLTFPARGEKGFGYDPIFVPEGDTRTYAEMDPQEKHASSHRARAFAKFVAALEG